MWRCWSAGLLLLLLVLLLVGATSSQAVPGMEGCDAEVPCQELEANGLTFQCRVAGPEDGTPVVLLHGFPEFSIHWVPLLRKWATESQPLRAVACDLRGYSPKASPSDPEEYLYETLATDVFAIAEAAGFDRFHLVGHDHGAGLGWLAASMDKGVRVLSWAALSVPHPDALSAVLFGPEEDEAQVVASNYFNQFALVDSATRNSGALAALMSNGGFDSPEALQPALWWYHGSIGRFIARPRVVDATTVSKYMPDAMLVLGAQQMIPLPVGDGEPAAKTTGVITGIPTLFVCGESDPYLQCSQPWAFRASDVDGSYTYYGASCQHGLLSAGEGACETEAYAQGAMGAITSHILLVSPPGAEATQPGAPDGTSGALVLHCPMMLALMLMSAAAASLLM